MKAVVLFSFAAALAAQTPVFPPLHVSAAGNILDSSGKPVLLRGLNRSGTGSGNADATATDQDYAAQNKLLSMNLVRIFVNATWWNNNVQVPIAGQGYQAYIDTLIQRSKKYGNYVLILKAGQFPDPPCGAAGQNCPASNQGDLNCQNNSSLCSAQDTTGNNIDAAFNFWNAFAAKYSSDPAVLYDTWEDMHGISAALWSDDQNQLIAAIRDYAPQSLIFVEDTSSAFESIVAGTLPDLAWSNIVWNFHLYNASITGCSEPASARYANWPRNIDPLVAYAQQNGHAVAFTEWGGCNDADPYHTNITSYARTHDIALVYFDSSNLLTTTDTLSATGANVAAAYTAIAALASAGPPVVSGVANAEGATALFTIAPNTWVQILGSGLAPAGDVRIWQNSDFAGGALPHQLDGVSVTVNGRSAYVYYISPTQINILTPPDAMLGPVPVVVTNNGVSAASASVTAQALSPSFFVSRAPYVLAQHGADYSLVGASGLFTGATPAVPGETIVIYANGFGPLSTPISSGALTQSGTLSTPPAVTIGGIPAVCTFAGINGVPGLFQFNVVVPANAPNGDLPLSASLNGISTAAGVLITVHQ